MSRTRATLQPSMHVGPLQKVSLRPGLLQRKCACGGTSEMDGQCEGCREKELGVQRFAYGQGGPVVAPPIVHEALRSPGQPLDADTRAFIEPRLGHDFSRVRVHSDAKSAESARAVGARAYTVGAEIVFGSGQYAPGSRAGTWLLVHELAHVAQQQGLPVPAQQLRRNGDGDGAGDDGGGDRTSASPSPATTQLQALINQIQGAYDGATARLSSIDDTEQQGDQFIGAVPAQLDSLRAVAAGDDESNKLAVLAAFSDDNVSAAQQMIASAGPSTAPAPQAAPSASMAAYPLQLGHPRAPAEVEADQIADVVLRGGTVTSRSRIPSGTLSRQSSAAAAPLIAVPAPAPPITAPVEAPWWADLLEGIGGALLLLLTFGALLKSDNPDQTCPPCPSPPPPEIDLVPPSAPHYPCPGNHWHYRVYNQDPVTCKCFLSGRLFGVSSSPT